MLKVSWRPMSLERPVGEEEDSELGSFIETNHAHADAERLRESAARAGRGSAGDADGPRGADLTAAVWAAERRSYTLEEVGQKFG